MVYTLPMISPSRRFGALFCGASLLLALSACGHPPRVLPQGEQTVSGLVKPAQISLLRRGTQVLVQNGAEIAYLESKTVDLHVYEGRVVEVTGTYEHNTDDQDLPVIVVTAVQGGSSDVRTYVIPALGVSIDVPREWKGTIAGTDAQFTASGALRPLLSLFLEDVSSASASSLTSEVTTDTLTIDGHRAVRLKNGVTRTQRITVDLQPLGASTEPAKALVILFTPLQEEEVDQPAWDAVVADILASVKFTDGGSSSSSSAAATSVAPLSGSGAGMPCGGTAGILCPAGMYCQITDTADNVGRCTPLR